MNPRKDRRFIAVGSLALSGGLAMNLWGTGRAAHFTSGFLLGLSIVLLLYGIARRPRGVEKP
jgi:hypothetical protein